MRLRLRWRWQVNGFPDLVKPVLRFFQSGYQHPPAAGLYSFRREQPGSQAHLHLRIEPAGQAVLMVNAARAYQLNPSAALMAYLILSGVSDQDALRNLAAWFSAPKADLCADYQSIKNLLADLEHPDGPCSYCELELETTMPFSAAPSAPYRMDLAVTYRCQNECLHCYNARARNHPELDSAQWKTLLDTLWRASIPHVVFTGGEPTLRKDLPELIAHANRNGQICGLNTNGRRLADPRFVESLVEAGLDHVQITLESSDPQIHDTMVSAQGAFTQTVEGIRNALKSKLYVMTNTTMLQSNYRSLESTLTFLAELGVPTVGLNALIYSGKGASVGDGLAERELPALLEIAKRVTEENGQRLIWYTPTRYCEFNPLSADLGLKGCTAARYSMCVEPDGAVLPCQSYYQSLGNLLTQPWQSIWNHDLALSLRERRHAPAPCQRCDLLQTCGGGCPLSSQSDPTQTLRPVHALLTNQELL